jgi:hypothetical protein
LYALVAGDMYKVLLLDKEGTVSFLDQALHEWALEA